MMTLEAMIRGLVRAAEFKEQDEDGMIWDDECRCALEEARRRGFGKSQTGEVGPSGRVSVTFACAGCQNSSQQPLTVESVPALAEQMERYAAFHGPGVKSHVPRSGIE